MILVTFAMAAASCEDTDDVGGGGGAQGGTGGGGVPDSVVWTDPGSGLTWQTVHQDPLTWDDANAYCDQLTLGGHDDWRLPTISDLRTLVRGCPTQSPDGACGVADDCLSNSCTDTCFPCVSGQGPTSGCYGPAELSGECGSYWSSSSWNGDGSVWWDFDFEDGFIDTSDYEVDLVRCVRP
ncbi:MAG: DUF1566 domain-containing protein [Deltaproteobacteria bacterium]|nr:DUF1566 domain-containing protein [Deltaproteobacteria bacterium]